MQWQQLARVDAASPALAWGAAGCSGAGAARRHVNVRPAWPPAHGAAQLAPPSRPTARACRHSTTHALRRQSQSAPESAGNRMSPARARRTSRAHLGGQRGDRGVLHVAQQVLHPNLLRLGGPHLGGQVGKHLRGGGGGGEGLGQGRAQGGGEGPAQQCSHPSLGHASCTSPIARMPPHAPWLQQLPRPQRSQSHPTPWPSWHPPPTPPSCSSRCRPPGSRPWPRRRAPAAPSPWAEGGRGRQARLCSGQQPAPLLCLLRHALLTHTGTRQHASFAMKQNAWAPRQPAAPGPRR